ncbi:DUF4194 domain-containing protein [Serratia sp. JUb9]|uniref:DUF4194 domain-containing protein n=1 Tax=Serratia sp. JUb9 TaxID=2724469 RepID=UPI00164D9B9C|nr:DUF4194 domain-containing protein [Serratia sp. JUb9]QNK31979.1 DUF4194 domain-containing protein [Serratia sp. JUb9]
MAGFFDRLVSQNNDVNSDSELIQQSDNTSEQVVEENNGGETRNTQKKLREATQELLKYGLLEEASKPNLYHIALAHSDEVRNILEPLDLTIGIDEIRGLLYVKVRLDETAESDEWSHPLVRRQRLNLEQSLLIAILRQHFIAWEQESGTGASQALISIDDIIPQLRIYLGDPGSESRERNRLSTLLDQLKGHGLVTSPDAHEQFTIRPIIAHLADPINLQALIAWLQEQLNAQASPDGESNKDDRKEERKHEPGHSSDE